MKRRNSTPLKRRFSPPESPLPSSTRLSKISRSAPAEKCRSPLRSTIARLPAFCDSSICSTMALMSFGPSRLGPVNHGQYGNIAALLARNQCILGHNAPPFVAQRCALVHLFRSAYNMTCSLQVMFAETSRSHDSHHFKRQGGSLHQSHGVSSGRPRDMPPLRPKAGFASPYFLKYVKRQRTSSSAPGPSCGNKSWALTRCPVSLSTIASFTVCPVFRSTNLSGGPALPETAHLSPTCASA